MHEPRTTTHGPRSPRRSRDTAAARPLERPIHAPHEDRVEVAVLGALGRLARRLGDSVLSAAR